MRQQGRKKHIARHKTDCSEPVWPIFHTLKPQKLSQFDKLLHSRWTAGLVASSPEVTLGGPLREIVKIVSLCKDVFLRLFISVRDFLTILFSVTVLTGGWKPVLYQKIGLSWSFLTQLPAVPPSVMHNNGQQSVVLHASLVPF